MIETKFSLELTQNGVQKTIYCRQGENKARKLSITATCNGKVISLDDYTEITILYDRIDPDTGSQCKVEAEHHSNPIEFTIPGFACMLAEERIFEVRFINGTETLYSPEFRVIVEANIAGETGEVDSPEVDQYVHAKDGYGLVNLDEYDTLKEDVADNSEDISTLKTSVATNTANIADLDTNKQDKSEMASYVTIDTLNDYATHVWVNAQGYATADSTVGRQEFDMRINAVNNNISEVSSSFAQNLQVVADAKQDKLTSANAGQNISITNSDGTLKISATGGGGSGKVVISDTEPTDTSAIWVDTSAESETATLYAKKTWVEEYVAEQPKPISYSTEEQDTGLTWIDGKKIYQRTLVITNLESTTTSTDYDITSWNINEIIGHNTIGYKEVDSVYVPLYAYGAEYFRWWCRTVGSTRVLRIMQTTGNLMVKAYVTLRYTKTEA